MPVPEDFRTAQLQATIFTPGLEFQNGRALGVFLGGWPDIFTNVVFAADIPALPPEAPHLVIQSQDSRYRLQAGPTRLDVFRIRQGEQDEIDVLEYQNWCGDVFARYLEVMRGRAGRLACIISRGVANPMPAMILSRSFCRDWMLGVNGPLERPADFELHAAKRYVLNNTFNVNSWLRCKTGTVAGGTVFPAGTQVITVEQDINTLQEELTTRQFSVESIREYLASMPGELDQILRLYFPPEIHE